MNEAADRKVVSSGVVLHDDVLLIGDLDPGLKAVRGAHIVDGAVHPAIVATMSTEMASLSNKSGAHTAAHGKHNFNNDHLTLKIVFSLPRMMIKRTGEVINGGNPNIEITSNGMKFIGSTGLELVANENDFFGSLPKCSHPIAAIRKVAAEYCEILENKPTDSRHAAEATGNPVSRKGGPEYSTNMFGSVGPLPPRRSLGIR